MDNPRKYRSKAWKLKHQRDWYKKRKTIPANKRRGYDWGSKGLPASEFKKFLVPE